MAVTGLSRPSVASLVARLERDGIVARSFGTDDRRTTLTSLTRKYRRRLDGLDEDLATYFTDSAPVVDEVLDLLRDDDPGTEGPVPEQSAPALAAASRLVEAMAGCAARLETVVPELGARCHLALMALVAKGPARPAELSAVLGLSSGGMTYLGNQLESEGLVERTYGLAEDRRAVSMALTPDGRRRAESLCAAVRESRTPLLMALATTRELAVPVA
jgi:DNA-binding MarR family transcriptional regulator